VLATAAKRSKSSLPTEVAGKLLDNPLEKLNPVFNFFLPCARVLLETCVVDGVDKVDRVDRVDRVDKVDKVDRVDRVIGLIREF
jgi:hypothetical protein